MTFTGCKDSMAAMPTIQLQIDDGQSSDDDIAIIEEVVKGNTFSVLSMYKFRKIVQLPDSKRFSYVSSIIHILIGHLANEVPPPSA